MLFGGGEHRIVMHMNQSEVCESLKELKYFCEGSVDLTRLQTVSDARLKELPIWCMFMPASEYAHNHGFVMGEIGEP